LATSIYNQAERARQQWVARALFDLLINFNRFEIFNDYWFDNDSSLS